MTDTDDLAAEVQRLEALIADARSYALSLNAGRGELPYWAQLRVDSLVKILNGSAPKACVASVRCFACASQQPEAACSHWVGIGWSCTDRKACRVRRATPHDPPTPRQALDGLFNGAAMGLGGVNAAKLFNIARKALDDAQAEADRLREGWAADRDGPKKVAGPKGSDPHG